MGLYTSALHHGIWRRDVVFGLVGAWRANQYAIQFWHGLMWHTAASFSLPILVEVEDTLGRVGWVHHEKSLSI